MEKKLLGIKPKVRNRIKKMSLTIFLIGMAVVVVGGTSITVRHVLNQEVEEQVITLNEIELVQLPRPVNLTTWNTAVMMSGVDLTTLTKAQQLEVIETELELLKLKTVTATYENQTLTTTLEDLGIQSRDDVGTILETLEVLIFELQEQSSSQWRLPNIFKVDYILSDEQVEMWVQSIAKQLNIKAIEPSLIMETRGNFTATEGQPGTRVIIEQLADDVKAVISSSVHSDLRINVVKETVEPTRETSLFDSVDTMIASAQSNFERADAGRSANVDLGAKLVTETLLMPGEEFSFNERVYPVTFENGFQYGTIFMDGQLSQGVGGGICQVSSTIYLAQLRAGILSTQRQPHSLPVFYVPRGLDATMFIGQIDYRFVNTLDYPLYLNAFTQGGTLTIEFWSHSEALDGLKFEPRSIRVETTDTTKSYDAFLGTYDAKTGQLISEVFLDRSTYLIN